MHPNIPVHDLWSYIPHFSGPTTRHGEAKSRSRAHLSYLSPRPFRGDMERAGTG